MTDMYDEKKVPEFTLPPYQHEDHGSEVCSNVLNKYVFLKCECVRGGGGSPAHLAARRFAVNNEYYLRSLRRRRRQHMIGMDNDLFSRYFVSDSFLRLFHSSLSPIDSLNRHRRRTLTRTHHHETK